MLLVCLGMILPRVAVWWRLLCSAGSLGVRCLMHDFGSTTGIWHLDGQEVSIMLHLLQSDECDFMRRAAWNHSCGDLTSMLGLL